MQKGGGCQHRFSLPAAAGGEGCGITEGRGAYDFCDRRRICSNTTNSTHAASSELRPQRGWWSSLRPGWKFSPSGLDAGDVARVLSLAVDGRALSVEAGEGFAAVNGRVNFRLVWQDRDGKPRGADYNADFNLRAEGGFSPEDSVTAEVSVTEADVRTGDKVVLTALISVRTEAMEEECLTDAENCYKTTGSVLLPVLAAAKTATVSVSEEAEAGEIDSVLLADARATAVSATAGDGVVTVEGRVRAAVTFLSDGEIDREPRDAHTVQRGSVRGRRAGRGRRVRGSGSREHPNSACGRAGRGGHPL